MNHKNNSIINSYVDLMKLKSEKILLDNKLGVVLSNDVWENNALLIKSGGYLTEDLINRLLNFGVKKVNVNFVYKNQINSLNQDFIKNQQVIILEDNFFNIAWLKRNLIKMGFNHENILVTVNYHSLNKYFKDKKINFIFIGQSLYEKSARCINKYSMLKTTHSFVLIEKEKTDAIKIGYKSKIKFLDSPLDLDNFTFLINQAL
ncbi:MAG: hypothetical protein ACOCV1_07060, partial [Bacillota bacterium]